MSEFATRQAFLTGLQRRFGEFTLPISGLKVRYRSLSEGEWSAHEMSSMERDAEGKLTTTDEAIVNSRAKLICLCLVDGEGNRLLNDGDVEQVNALDARDTMALYDELRDFLGISARVARAETQRKNSPTPPG